MIILYHRISEPAYYIVDWRISAVLLQCPQLHRLGTLPIFWKKFNSLQLTWQWVLTHRWNTFQTFTVFLWGLFESQWKSNWINKQTKTNKLKLITSSLRSRSILFETLSPLLFEWRKYRMSNSNSSSMLLSNKIVNICLSKFAYMVLFT